jgi:hypothetical protein
MEKLCECGCGELTVLAKWTDKRRGTIKGEPLKFLQGHNKRGIRSKTHCRNGHSLLPNNYKMWGKILRCKTCLKQRLENRREVHRVENRTKSRCRKEELVKLRGGKCLDCNGEFPACCFHFDHRSPLEKSFNIVTSMPMEKVITELEKCDMVCANCHAIRTFGNKDISDKISRALRKM